MILLSIIFYKFITIYQEALYDGNDEPKKVYKSEIAMLLLFTISLLALILPQVFDYIEGIIK